MEEQFTSRGQVRVSLDRNQMHAYLEVFPPTPEGKPCTFEQAIQSLHDNGVVFGINEEEIRRALREQNWGSRIMVAEGAPATDGGNAQIIYHFPLPHERANPKMDEKGNVNYLDLGIVYNVKAGTMLVERVPPTDGEEGKTVKGETIKARKGKDLRLPRGSNTVCDEQELYLYATVDGNVSVIDGRVVVNQMFEIRGDVDYSTGNIDFIGNVLISGNINSSFKVKAGGDIEIGGFIEGAEVVAGGNILVKGGITGGVKGQVIAGESIYARFAENARLEAGKDVIIREAIMQSVVKAGNSIVVNGNRATIVGGVLQAAYEVESKIMGSQLATQTIVEVGVNPHYRDEYQQLVKSHNEKTRTMETLNHNLQVLQRSGIKPENLTEKKRLDLIQMLDSYKTLRQQITQMEERIAFLENEFQRAHAARVRALDIVYPGVRITIGQAIYVVNDPIKYSQFVLEGGEVRLSSLR